MDRIHKVLSHATEDDYNQIMDVFKLHKAYFPHIRGDKIKRMIDSKNVVWEDGVLITWNRYKRKQKVGEYQAQKGDCILHQIAARDQGNGSAKKVFEKFKENVFTQAREMGVKISILAGNANVRFSDDNLLDRFTKVEKE